MIIGQFIYENSNAKELWYVVSPQNPFKKNQTILDDRQRLHMVNLAINDPYHVKASDIEFNLPKPSYTAITLAHLSEKHPDKKFAIVMGSDNLVNFHKWKNYESILEHHQIIVYPRKGKETDRYASNKNVHRIVAPEIELSSTLIRNGIKEGRDVSQMLPFRVWEYLDSNSFYKR